MASCLAHAVACHAQSVNAYTPNNFGSTIGFVSDVFVGRNTVGPYLITWRNIEPGSETVLKGTRRMSRDEYRLDTAAGVLSFTQPIRNQEMVRVDYRTNGSKSQKNTVSFLTPTQFNLFEQFSGALKLSAIIMPDKPGLTGGNVKLPLMFASFGAASKLSANSAGSARLFLDLQGGDVKNRTGLLLTEQTNNRLGNFSARFSRAGVGFRADDEAHIGVGKQILELQANLTSYKGIAASASFTRSEQLDAKGNSASTVTALSEKLSGTLGATGRFLFTRSDSFSDNVGSPSTARSANRLQVDQRIGSKTQATAIVEHISTANGSSTANNQTNTLLVRSQPTEQLSLSGTFASKLLSTGPEDSSSIRIDARPNKLVKLTAALSDRISRESTKHTREATMEYSPDSRLTLNGSLQMQANSGDLSIARGLTATARPYQFVEVSGGLKIRESMVQGVSDPAIPNSYNAKIALMLPRKVLTLQAGYGLNAEDDRGTITHSSNRTMSVMSTVGPLSLSGGYTLQEDTLSLRTVTNTTLNLGLKVTKSTLFSTTYTNSQTLDHILMSQDTFGLRLSHQIGSFLDFMVSGQMVTNSRDGLSVGLPE